MGRLEALLPAESRGRTPGEEVRERSPTLKLNGS